MILADTGVFGFGLSGRHRTDLAPLVERMRGQQVYIAVQTVAELRYGALAAGWGLRRVAQLEDRIATAIVLPVTDRLLDTVAEFRDRCRRIGHPLASAVHHADLWIAANAIDSGLPLLTADHIFRDAPGLQLA